MPELNSGNLTNAVPDHPALDDTARNILAGATPAAPHLMTYSDVWASQPPDPSSLKGYNVFALAFILTTGPVDNAKAWVDLSDSHRKSIKSQYATAGISLVVAAFGSTNLPTNTDPVSTANNLAQFVKTYDLDGIDIDYEDFDAFWKGDGKAEDWLISFTKQLRSQLPQGKYTLTHAPVGPWFRPDFWKGGGYLKVHKEVGDLIDWYNVQFYNQGSEYTTLEGLITKSSGTWPQTAVFQIKASGVPIDKIVIGKPATKEDASSGYMDVNTLAQCVKQAKSEGWNAGVTVWQYPHADANWINTVWNS